MRSQVTRKMPFTEEQMQKIYNTNIIDFAREHGFEVEKGDKATLHVKNSGGLYLFKHGRGFYCFTEEKGGNIVEFAMKYLNMEKLEAMELILGSKAYEQTTHVVAPQEKPERGELQLPPRDQNDRRVFAYLTKTRKIDPEIVQDMMKQGRVYQSRQEINGKIRVNCAFIGYDEKEVPRYCALRGPSADSSFRQDMENSDKTYGFIMTGRSQRVYEFEAPIDAMSHVPVGIPVKKGVINRAALNEWWKGRAIPASRAGIRNALEQLNLSTTQKLLEQCLGLSLSDQYWICPAGSGIEWS